MSVTDLDELTRKRLEGSEPDWYLLLEIKGWSVGDTDMARWLVTTVDWSEHIDPENYMYIAEIMEKVVAVIRQEHVG